jgi:restriction endonuclease S subunit
MKPVGDIDVIKAILSKAHEKLKTAQIDFENERALASNHVHILRPREESPIYVGVVLNSIIGRLQTRRLVTGSAQVELYPGDIDKFIIPFVDIRKQEQISNLIEESYRARREAKTLLEEAKKKVEEIIEKGQDN